MKKPPSTLPLGKLDPELLQGLLKTLPIADPTLVLPPKLGHDAAAVKIGDNLIAVTTDPITFTTDRLGTYSVAVNINDIACLGCKPRWYSATLLLPPNTEQKTLQAIWDDLSQQLKHYRITAIGGHTEVSDAVTRPVLVGQLIGEPMGTTILDPRQIKPGDQLLLWQRIGIEGSAILAKECFSSLQTTLNKADLLATQRWLDTPGICVYPFVEQLLPNTSIVALHDPTEGGIATALHELAIAANCGLQVNQSAIAIHPTTQALCQQLHINPLGLLSSGALLLVCKSDGVNKLLQQFANEPLVHIGEFIQGNDCYLNNNGQRVQLPQFTQDELIRVL